MPSDQEQSQATLAQKLALRVCGPKGVGKSICRLDSFSLVATVITVTPERVITCRHKSQISWIHGIDGRLPLRCDVIDGQKPVCDDASRVPCVLRLPIHG